MRYYFYLVIIFVACGSGLRNEPIIQQETATSVSPIDTFSGLKEDSIMGVGVSLVQDFTDFHNASGTILVLPGWDFERHRWLDETKLRQYAKSHRYRLILPDMKRSIYATHFYPETTPAAKLDKTGKWVTDTFIPAIQKKYGLLKPGEKNYVLGLSTGGRGAVYCAWKLPKVFKAAATLSGDFDQTRLSNDFLMISVYGTYAKNKLRWMHDDNLFNVADSIKVPLFIAHGEADHVVPFSQSLEFYKKINQTNAHIKKDFVAGAGHDFKFWGGELPPVLDFFSTLK